MTIMHLNSSRSSLFFVLLHILALLCFSGSCYIAAADVDDINRTSEESKSIMPIGVVLDFDSPLGSMADLCMKMALSDFYSAHPNYTTRLQLYTKDADTVLDANFAAVELLKSEDVQGIIGPQGSTEEAFFSELGERVQVPIISFTAKSSAHSYAQNRYFVRTTPDDAVQAKALATICKGFEWPQVAVLYEDTNYGNQFVSYLNNALQEVEVGLAYMVGIPESAENSHISKELEKLTKKQTRVFVVHMNPSLGYRLFALAKRAGVMSEGYAWIITDSLSNFMSSMDIAMRESMEGVLGIRPYVSRSKDLESFQERWKRNVILKNYTKGTNSVMELNVYGLWAYDAVTALAIAAEKVLPMKYSTSSDHVNVTTNNTNLRISAFGPRLLQELSGTRFSGLSGEFGLVDGKLNSTAYEIFNVVGTGEKTIGFWTPERGIVRDLSSDGEINYSTSTNELRRVMWPGDSITKPTGWAIPATGHLRVGVPWKHGYTDFVNVVVDPVTNRTNATGFSIDVFLAALDALPFHVDYEFINYNDTTNPNWSYDDMLQKIPETFDVVVGDTTVWAPRANYVDFSLPYSESGVVLVVKNKKPFDMWIFIRPLRWDLWLAIILACILMGIVLRILEQRVTSNGMGTPKKQSRMVYLSPLSVLAFPERNMVTNRWSVFVLVCWLFMAFILMQSYTANLSAILTVDQLKFAFSDNYYVGFQDGSFMKKFLVEKLNIPENRLRGYASAGEYHDAMSKGSKNEGIDAIFDEVPYMKLFLNKYDSQYKMVGPTYRTGGFGFAFPVGSPLVQHFSKAILDVTQSPNMTTIEQTNFGPGYSSEDPLSSRISQETSSLTLYEFAGLFLIVGSVTIFALFCSVTPIGKMLTDKAVHFFRCSKTTTNNSVEDSSISADSTQGGTSEMQDYESSDARVEDAQVTGEETVQDNLEGVRDTDDDYSDWNLGTRIDSNGERNS